MNQLIRSKLALIAPAMLGVGAAVLTTLAMHRADARAHDAAPAPSASGPSQALTAPSPAAPRPLDLAPIERRLTTLEARGPHDADEAIPTEPESPPPDPDEAWRATQAHHDEQIERHRDEPVDATWSSPAESLLRADLGTLAEGRSYRVTDLDCKTSSCVATLEWPSYATASQEAIEVISATHRVNCATSVWTPAPDDPAAPYRADILFDCSLLRAGRADAVAQAPQ